MGAGADRFPGLARRTRAKYRQLIEPLRATARRAGYALGVHGSLARDIDIIAAPWTPEALWKLRRVLRALEDCAAAAIAAARHAPLIGHHPTAMANLVSAAFEDEARTRLGSTRGVKLISHGQRFLVAVGGVLVRFKKLDVDYKTKNYRTRGSLRFDHQVPLAELPPHPRVTLGYRVNRLGTSILDLSLVFSRGRYIEWVHPLRGSAVVAQLPLFPMGVAARPARSTPTKRNRVKVKRLRRPAQNDNAV